MEATRIGLSGAKILVVDDEPAIVEAISYSLRQQGCTLVVAGDADEALRLVRSEQPDLVILDVMLPSGSGFDVCRLIRSGGGTMPILMLTARIAESDRVQGLEIGADDYVVKPFGMRELTARVKALLRRSGSGDSAGNVLGPNLVSPTLQLIVDLEKREVTRFGEIIKLSRKEFDLLALLTAHPGRVFDRPTLLDKIWGQNAFVDERTVDVHIRWLREKIEPEPSSPSHLTTVRGVGYKFLP